MFNLPLQGMSKAVAKLLGNQAGRLVEVEKDENGSCLGRFLNVRVIVDINQPLKRGAMFRISFGGHTIWVNFRYVRLPYFCFWYGKIGHTLIDCFEEIPDDVRRGKQEPNYDVRRDRLGGVPPLSVPRVARVLTRVHGAGEVLPNPDCHEIVRTPDGKLGVSVQYKQEFFERS
ncbi:Zinc knuckle CX2CX4HX4C [Parasponia andersonii]|uniref:Zinc knuckle CX2CX4HX4C n=1 Tax=Parasponia andersonii TaxID=3476 RepID=A0A2P5AKF7_PARAD|nr:Zinc knuckle CX2CX4HX4C [Parasponia andersonii]